MSKNVKMNLSKEREEKEEKLLFLGGEVKK